MLSRSHMALATLLVATLGYGGLRLAGNVVPGPNLLFNGWGLAPTGDHVRVGDMPVKMTLSPDRKQAVLTSVGFDGVHITTVDVATQKTIESLNLAHVWNGIAFSNDGKTLYVAGGNTGKLLVYGYDAGHLTKQAEATSRKGSFISGVAVHPKTGVVYALNEALDEILRMDGENLAVVCSTGRNPHTLAFGADPRYAYVSDWGSREVTVIDTQLNLRVRDFRVGVRPNDMALAPDGRLFVTCAGDNTVHIIQTRKLENAAEGSTPGTRIPEGVREILNTSIEPTILEGSTPDGVAISPDGKTLYVANADNNDVMVADIGDPKQTHIAGFIPTGWYPTSVAATDDRLLVAVGKGLRSRANAPVKGEKPRGAAGTPKFDYIGNTLEGYVSFVKIGDAEQLKKWTAQVRAADPFYMANVRATAAKTTSIVPDEVGKSSPIKHVLYVIMENRTYDQVYGDLAKGNADPSLCMYGEKVTPNRHALAREYTLLDNFYCNGEVSVDGHSWCDAAIADDANERDWTSSYASHGHVTDAGEPEAPAGGYIWEIARKAGLSVKCYGEGTNSFVGGHAVPRDCRGTWPEGRDKDRVQGWIADLHAAEKTGQWANFQIMSLGEDHTRGTSAGAPTPNACVASNDVAIGKIVEAASKSRFWKDTAIFFVEDDAQNGPDHVDAHRTFALVVSPYVRRGIVDSTMYSQAGMVRTIELLLGLSPMTQYDTAAMPMFATFSKTPTAVQYKALPALVDLEAKNPARGVGAEASARMDFSEYDRAPADELNEILWAVAKPGVPYPGSRRSYGR